MPNHWVITFESVYFVMKAERILKENGIETAIIPTPREISSNCGMAIEVDNEALDSAKDLLKKNGVGPETIHEWKKK